MSNTRATAAGILAELMAENGSLSSHLTKHYHSSDFQLLQEYCYGCCRWFYSLRFFLDRLLNKPLKDKDSDILALLLVGIYQLREMRTPNHAAINETVAAVIELKKPWAKGLVNAVLRNFLRKQSELEALASDEGLAVGSAHPQWLVDKLSHCWPEQHEAIIENNNCRPPMTLRVNTQYQSRDDYLRQLDAAGIQGVPGRFAETAIYLDQPHAVSSLPGFDASAVSVQDEASQLVPAILRLQAKNRVLDACAAPGGKTCHILESECSLTELVSLDMSSERLQRIRENLDRLQLEANVTLGDATDTAAWWDGRPFDRILLDAPCSATGVIRRHPDIKLLRRKESIAKLQRKQLAILHSIWQCLASNGLLLYTTCSVLPEENNQVIELFLQQQQDAKYEGVIADWGVECRYGRQLLPLEQQGPDGFFYSLLRKQ